MSECVFSSKECLLWMIFVTLDICICICCEWHMVVYVGPLCVVWEEHQVSVYYGNDLPDDIK